MSTGWRSEQVELVEILISFHFRHAECINVRVRRHACESDVNLNFNLAGKGHLHRHAVNMM